MIASLLRRYFVVFWACALSSPVSPASAAVLFDNPGILGSGTQWCDPCSSGNTGYRVWDSFTLSQRSTLQSMRWVGLRSDALSLGVDVEIARAPYGSLNFLNLGLLNNEPHGPDIFSAHYSSPQITVGNAGISSSFRVVELPDIILDAGTYWLTVHGPSNTEQHTWLGEFEANGDNSFIQYGADPNNPQFVIPRHQDAVFRLTGLVTAVPEASTWAMMILGFCGVGFLAVRRKVGRVRGTT
ncbi:hypothetical protein L6654_41295 [Bradyrhizobium sp. WYCCWR 13023]|uniref:Ice-binding protein C-terminal domain-containing protein n=1 Tax=Bradyrhizobium zhengyangense TaxID=2911009 RepID=A0A9X1UJZ5_9BRAD|nr:PEP-CTERM sorting domain-containing protein [Bradyrhizobium zhengyangense]MCG2633002.1 hypothetical protein [Bradyrhizobium zhengyangense]